MVKTGRNAPCPCDSGKKYKHCCLPQDQAAAIEAAAQREAQQTASQLLDDQADDDLDELSNRVIDLIDAGRLAEAEAACQELRRRYPDTIDWLERTGMLHEARGERDQAIDYYERCLAYIDQHLDFFEEASRDWYHRSICRLKDSPEPTDNQADNQESQPN